MLLYKLCYYTTPFEEQGQLAILNARFTIPAHPMFSDGLKRLIVSLLQEDQNRRPDIYQVVKAVSDLRGVPCPIRNVSQTRKFHVPQAVLKCHNMIRYTRLSPRQKSRLHRNQLATKVHQPFLKSFPVHRRNFQRSFLCDADGRHDMHTRLRRPRFGSRMHQHPNSIRSKLYNNNRKLIHKQQHRATNHRRHRAHLNLIHLILDTLQRLHPNKPVQSLQIRRLRKRMRLRMNNNDLF